MFHTTFRRSARSAHRLGLSLLSATALFASVSAVGAQPPAPAEAEALKGNPHATVASDGVLPEASMEGALSGRFGGISPLRST